MTYIHYYEKGYIKLVRLLKLLGFYERYIVNMCEEDILIKYKEPFSRTSIHNSIVNSFVWRGTKEGDSFWRLIYNESMKNTEISEMVKDIKEWI